MIRSRFIIDFSNPLKIKKKYKIKNQPNKFVTIYQKQPTLANTKFILVQKEANLPMNF